MKRWLPIIVILLAGIVAALWLGGSGPAIDTTPGPRLSSNALARVRLAGGHNHALAIAPDGSLWSWGDGLPALGQGLIGEPVMRPTRVGSDKDWAEVSASFLSSFALKRDGSLWAWGGDAAAVFGYGTNGGMFIHDVPMRAGRDTDWVAVDAGLHHAAGLKRDGSLWTWGDNTFGQLGIGPTTNKLLQPPARMGSDTHWKALALGAYTSVALKTDGTLWTWGDSSRSPTPVPNNPTNNHYPVQIGTDTNWVVIAAGQAHTLALKSDGTLWHWGRNSHLLGGIPASDMSQLRQLGTESNWAEIHPGGYKNLARKRDGSVWLLGANRNLAGQVVSVPGECVATEGGIDFQLAVTPDGRLWHWGRIPGFRQKRNMLAEIWREIAPLFGASPKRRGPLARQNLEVIFRWNEPAAPNR
jgi:alpha-tubulin suppressor-like RCC1 family protein